ncbi:hypothetical protein ACFL0Y_02275 [Patescibacteria group bacterium]
MRETNIASPTSPREAAQRLLETKVVAEGKLTDAEKAALGQYRTGIIDRVAGYGLPPNGNYRLDT